MMTIEHNIIAVNRPNVMLFGSATVTASKFTDKMDTVLLDVNDDDVVCCVELTPLTTVVPVCSLPIKPAQQRRHRHKTTEPLSSTRVT